MNTEFTAGDWEVSKHGTPEAFPQFGVYAVGDPKDLAIVKGDRAKADAQLIAAAPDLLKALQRCAPWMGKLIAEGVHERAVLPNDAIRSLAMAEAAIAKAVGK
jgi:hypothetical protein